MISVEKTRFQAEDDLELTGYLYHPGKPSGRGAVFLHGYGGTKSSGHRIAFELAERGVTVLAYDQRGSLFGETEGCLEIPLVLSDIKRAIDHIPASGPVDLVGHSMGAALALLSSGEERVGRVVIMATGADMQRAFEHPILSKILKARCKYVEGLEVQEAMHEVDEDALVAARGLEKPALFVAGEDDPVAPPESVRKLAGESEFRVVLGDHSDIPESAADVVVEWLLTGRDG